MGLATVAAEESVRGDADDLHRLARGQLHRSPQRRLSGPECLGEILANHCPIGRAETLVFRKIAPENGSHPEDSEVLRADVVAFRQHSLSRAFRMNPFRGPELLRW